MPTNLDNCKDLSQLEESYDIYAANCRAAMKSVLSSIEIMKEYLERSKGAEDNPFETIEHRIKNFKSAYDKCIKRGYANEGKVTIDTIKDKVLDVAGIRITTVLPDAVYKIVELFRQLPNFAIVREKDYIKKRKDNGYRSFHLQLQVPVFFPGMGTLIFPVEVQIRSQSMHCWATIEHKLNYKQDYSDPRIVNLFKDLSDSLIEADRIAMSLRDSIHQSGGK